MDMLQKNETQQKKQVQKYIRWGILAAVVFALAVMPMLASERKGADGPEASVLTAVAEIGTIDTQLIGGGQLASEASINIRIPENVKLTDYLVGNGDVVSEGDVIANIDRVSVMTAITQVQETLDYLSEEITAAASENASGRVKALSGGTVKILYAEEGESVQDVMLDHGALAVLSLDGLMAVRIERKTALNAGDTVNLNFSDGSEAEGTVVSNLDGVLTITVEDEDYPVGTKAIVTTEDGGRLGSGELYIFNQWNAAAYSGTVKDILVAEGDTVYVGQTLISVEDTGNTAKFQRLIDQRQEYEALMQELFQMYRTESLTAPCDGIVTGVDEDGAYLLSGEGETWFTSLLSFFRKEKTGFVAYAARVASVSEEGMELWMDPSGILVNDLTVLSTASVDLSAMTESWHYSGDTTISIQSAGGLLRSAGRAKAGDVLLVVGDEEQVRWFVVLNGSGQEGKTTAAPDSGITLSLCSAEALTGEAVTQFSPETMPVPEESRDAVTEAAESQETVPTETEPSETETTPEIDVPEEGPEQVSVSILTTALNQAIVGQSYYSPLQASDGTEILPGIWAAAGLPDGLEIDAATGVISGTPVASGSYEVTIAFAYDETPVIKVFTLIITQAETETKTYTGIVAQVMEAAEGMIKVKQAASCETITDLNNLPNFSVEEGALTEEATYTSPLLTAGAVAVNDYLLIVLDQDGTLKTFVKQGTASGENQKEEGIPGLSGGQMAGGMTDGGGVPGGVMAEVFEPYSLNKLTVASVTSQEHMRVSITVDELDITRLSVGQGATVSVDALGGEQFDAVITKIAASGENEGGNSKFAVELTLSKSGEMLPGMYSSAFIPLYSAADVVCIPVAALDKMGTESIVYTSYDEETGTLGAPVAVTIGASDGETVEIISGLTPGESCYYAYYDTYTDSDTPQQSGVSFGFMGRR